MSLTNFIFLNEQIEAGLKTTSVGIQAPVTEGKLLTLCMFYHQI